MYRVALLDMYEGFPNQGIGNIKNLVKAFPELKLKAFDVRGAQEIPDTSFDIYIFSGGPGDPREIDPAWGDPFFGLIDQLWELQKNPENPEKHCFFICHSFQMLSWHWKIGTLSKRHARAFGVYPVHKTKAGMAEPLFEGLPDPFYTGDFRDFQVTEADSEVMKKYGTQVMALEKIRPHVNRDRAIMAMRFSDTWFGTQFHPEASPVGMLRHFTKPDKRDEILEFKAPAKYLRMITELHDPNKLGLTYCTVLPRFLRNAIQCFEKVEALC